MNGPLRVDADLPPRLAAVRERVERQRDPAQKEVDRVVAELLLADAIRQLDRRRTMIPLAIVGLANGMWFFCESPNAADGHRFLMVGGEDREWTPSEIERVWGPVEWFDLVPRDAL